MSAPSGTVPADRPAGASRSPERRAGFGDWVSLVKFSHTIFALPFALASLLVATGGQPSLGLLALVIVAMVCARTAAMAYNRLVDRRIDALNPRTRGREIPAGILSPFAVAMLVMAASAGFLVTAGVLGRACLWMAVPTLVVLLGYSHAKRFTVAVHLWLGVALGLAPPAAWLAARGEFTADLVVPSVLGAAVAVWVAGFDILYACQDSAFDAEQGLHSVPARFGRLRALWLARGLHALAVVGFAGFGVLAHGLLVDQETGVGLGWIYQVGVLVAAVLLFQEHRLVRADDLSRIGAAFFTMNGAVGLAMLGFVAVDLYAPW